MLIKRDASTLYTVCLSDWNLKFIAFRKGFSDYFLLELHIF